MGCPQLVLPFCGSKWIRDNGYQWSTRLVKPWLIIRWIKKLWLSQAAFTLANPRSERALNDVVNLPVNTNQPLQAEAVDIPHHQKGHFFDQKGYWLWAVGNVSIDVLLYWAANEGHISDHCLLSSALSFTVVFTSISFLNLNDSTICAITKHHYSWGIEPKLTDQPRFKQQPVTDQPLIFPYQSTSHTLSINVKIDWSTLILQVPLSTCSGWHFKTVALYSVARQKPRRGNRGEFSGWASWVRWFQSGYMRYMMFNW